MRNGLAEQGNWDILMIPRPLESNLNVAFTIESVPRRGYLAQFMNGLFPSSDTSNFNGTLIVEVEGGMVAATAFELGSGPGQFISLAVIPLF